MEKVCDIYDFLNSLAPVTLKMDFDNVGLLVGDADAEVKSVLLALDITDAVIDEAVKLDAGLIVSHHPVIFEPMKSIVPTDHQGRKVISLIRNGISAICMHTNLDIAEGGVNDALASALGGRVTGFLEPCGRICELPREIELNDFLFVCKEKLSCGGIRYHSAGRPVKKLAVLGGSGASSLALAAKSGCDTFVTSDIKYNHFLEAAELGINLIDADHFCTENVIIPVLHDKLTARFPDIRFTISKVHTQTAKFY